MSETRMASSDEEEKEKRNSSENLEMAAGKFSSNTRILVEDSIMTVSLDEDERTEFMLDISQGRCKVRCTCLKQNIISFIILLVLLLVSATLSVFTIVKNKDNLKKQVRDFITILRYASIFGFLGGSTVLISHFLVFSTRCSMSLLRISRKEFGQIEATLRRFVESMVFEETFLKQYVRRVISLEENSYSKTLLNVIDSDEFDRVLRDRLAEFVLTPEGFIVNMFNIGDEDLFTYIKAYTVEIISLMYPMVVRTETNVDSVRPETVRRHVLAIISERFGAFDYKEYAKLTRNVTRRRRDLLTAVSTVLMVLVGCVAGSLEVFVFGVA